MATTTDLERLARVRQRCRTGEAKAILEAAQISAAEAAREVDISHVSMHRWLTGAARPRGEPARRFDLLLETLDRVGKAAL